MGILIFPVFAAIWYLPLFLKHRKTVREPAKYYLIAFALGLASGVAATAVQLIFGYLTKSLNLPGIWAEIFGFAKVLVVVAVVEELLKLYSGYLVIKKIPDISEAGCMLIMGMVGVGFEFFESIAVFDVLTAVLRGLTALHIFFQLLMGKYLWRALQARMVDDTAAYTGNMRTALLWPVALHTAFDYPVLKAVSLVDKGLVNEKAGLIMIGFALLVAFTSMAVIMISARRTLKEEIQ